MNTSTTWRRRMGAATASGTLYSSWSASVSYWRDSRTRNSTISGTRATMTQAPWVNLVMAMTMSTHQGHHRADTVDHQPASASPAALPQMVAGHAGLGERNEVKTPMAMSRSTLAP